MAGQGHISRPYSPGLPPSHPVPQVWDSKAHCPCLGSLPLCIKRPHKVETSLPLLWKLPQSSCFLPQTLVICSVPGTALQRFLSPSANTWVGMPLISHFSTQVQGRHHASPILSYLEQLAMWMAGPRQLRPPQRGRGESQDRARHRQEPELSPSKCSHGCHGDHGPKPPSRVIFRTCRLTEGAGPLSQEAGAGRFEIPGHLGNTDGSQSLD